jgi:pimeloyl-ACP methyl ester carboxylesterase
MPTLARIEANGVEFAYYEEGSGPLVLLLHGFPDTAHTWDETRPALAAAGYRAVSPYMRGYHPTSIPADGLYDSDTLGRDALALIEALGVESAIVVGHGWGAGAAYAAAGLGPARVRILMTIGIPHPASVLPTPRLLWGIRHFLRFQRKSAEALVMANDFAHVDELLERWSPAWDVPQGESDAVKESFRHPGSLSAALGYYRALTVRIPASQRKRVSMPGVAFSGDDDGVTLHKDYERARSRYASSYEVVRMPGGHFMHREHPKRFNEELLRALRTLAPVA